MQIAGRFAVLFDFPGFLTLHQLPERYGTWSESDPVPWSDSRRPFSARSPLLSPSIWMGPTRGVGRTRTMFHNTLVVDQVPESQENQAKQ